MLFKKTIITVIALVSAFIFVSCDTTDISQYAGKYALTERYGTSYVSINGEETVDFYPISQDEITSEENVIWLKEDKTFYQSYKSTPFMSDEYTEFNQVEGTWKVSKSGDKVVIKLEYTITIFGIKGKEIVEFDYENGTITSYIKNDDPMFSVNGVQSKSVYTKIEEE
jgi:hypothetical protein